MNKLLISWNNWLKNKMILLVLLGLISGLFFPWSNGEFLEVASMLSFGYMTLVVSLDNGIREFFRSLTHPGLLLICLLLVHALVPVWAILWGHLFFADQELIRLGFLIAAGIPVGVTSIIWTSISGGKTALALAVVTMDTIICPLFMPLYLRLVAGATVQVDFWPLFIKLLLMVTIPALIGMLLKE
ncbi:MAG: bile acid:sodium symporter, partial [Clostridia bacterium]|nr:bile acid:sodium symporter [Clostridia bacterium]